MTITTRSGKGSELSWNELDGNFTDLDTRTALGWRDNIVEMTPDVGNPDAPQLNVFRGNIKRYSFPAGQLTEVSATFHIDHDYALGTNLYLHAHWSVTGTGIGTARWGFEYSVAKGHQQQGFSAPVTVYVEQTTTGTAYMHYVAEVSDGDAINGVTYDIEPDTLIIVRCFRDGGHVNDTLAADAFGLCLDLHYQADKNTTPYKRPDFMTGP